MAYVSATCLRCGARRDTWVIWGWRPAVAGAGRFATTRPAFTFGRRHCLDKAACAARRDRKREVAGRRRGRFVMVEPKVPDAPRGRCRWCGEPITGANATRRRYHYAKHGERDCNMEYNLAITYEPRVAVRHREFTEVGCLMCKDCGEVCEVPLERFAEDPLRVHREHTVLKRWEADHEHALEDGGPHELDNIFCRCVGCHRRKTAREVAARRAVSAA